MLLNRRSRRQTSRRGTSVLEFALVLPIMLFLVAMVVDVGRLLMVTHAMQEATYRSARASAVVGGANVSRPGSNQPVYQQAFNQAIAEVPGANQVVQGQTSLTVVSGGKCQFATAAGNDEFVTIRATYTVRLLTPGLGGLLGLAAGDSNAGSGLGPDFTMNAASLSRCEVVAP